MLKKVLQHCGVDEEYEVEDFPNNFFPVPERYIVYQTGSERKSQVYDYSPEVISLISNILKKYDIQVLQIGDVDDPQVPSSIDLRGKVSIRQLAFIIKNSLLCVTSNRFSAKLCRTFEKNVVLLGSNFPSKSVIDYFKGLSYLEPDIDVKKWSYREEENPKLINQIKPEKISKTILEKLLINIETKFETAFIGEKFGPQVIDFVPDGPVPQNLPNSIINLRLDIVFNELFVKKLSSENKIFITTDRPINFSNSKKDNINSVSYFFEKDPDIDFIKNCKKNKIKVFPICSNEDFLNDSRLDLLGISEVYKKISQKPLDFSNFCGTLFKTSRFYISKGKTYMSLFHMKNGIESAFEGVKISDEALESEDFWESKESMFIFKV